MKQPNYFLSMAYNLIPVFLAISLTNLAATKSSKYKLQKNICTIFEYKKLF